MVVSDYISIGAICVSILAIIVSIILYKNQKRYTENQDKLNEILLDKERKQIELSKTASISANVIKDFKNYKIRIFNKGASTANNVDISYPEDHNWIIINDVLPIEFLESGKSIDLPLAIAGSAQRKLKVILTWEDVTGEKKTEVILTL